MTDIDVQPVVTACDNILLKSLLPVDVALLEPHVTRVTVPRDSTLLKSGDAADAVYFPETALLSVKEPVRRSGSLEIAVVGREGLVGWSALLGGQRADHTVVTHDREGTLIRIDADALIAACRDSFTLWRSLLNFVHILIVQMSSSIASHLRDPLDLRLARWLLMRHDRVSGDQLRLHHDEIAECLGTRRASITDKLHLLEGERLVYCTRGRLTIRDRRGLEAFAGAAYGGAEAHYRTLIAPFGK